MLFFPRCFDPVAFLFFATNYFFCPFFLFLYAYYSRYCFFASVFLFSFMFCVSFFHNGFLSVCFFHAVCSFFISFLSTFPLFIPSYAVFIRERSFSYICFIIFFPFYDPFDLFLFFFFLQDAGLAIVFYFLASSIGFLRIYTAPDIRTRSDRFVDFFPFCFANDRLIPYRSDVSVFSFICHGCFIPIPPCFFLIDARVFFRLCRLSVAFLSAFSSCFGKEASVRFSSVVRLVFALFPLRFICFGSSLSVYLFSNKKKRISALFVCFTSFFRLLLIPL